MSAMNYIFQNGLKKEMQKHFDAMVTEMLIATAEFQYINGELSRLLETSDRSDAAVETLTKRFFGVRRRVLIAAKTVRKFAGRINEMVDDPPDIESHVRMAVNVVESLETPEAAALESELATLSLAQQQEFSTTVPQWERTFSERSQ